jgi:uncharacterized membrane protein
MISLCIAIAGLILLAAAPLPRTGMIFALTLAATLGLTLFDMGTHQDTRTDLAGFTLALMVGGIALVIRSERGMKR